MKKIMLLSALFALFLGNAVAFADITPSTDQNIKVTIKHHPSKFDTKDRVGCDGKKLQYPALIGFTEGTDTIEIDIPDANANKNANTATAPQNVNILSVGGNDAGKSGGGVSTENLLYTILAIMLLGGLIALIVYLMGNRNNRRRNLFPYFGQETVRTITDGGGGTMLINYDENGNPSVDIRMCGTSVNSLELAKLRPQQPQQQQQTTAQSGAPRQQ